MPRAPTEDLLRRWRGRIEGTIDALLPQECEEPQALHRAMRHAALPAGKCLRGSLVYACGEILGVEEARLDAAAAALELTHSYSLVHDDLPCMDDSARRRGRPSCHLVHGDATAMLAGNALLLCALDALADDDGPCERILEASSLLHRASGSLGMAGGQQLDLEWQGGDTGQLEALHLRKTGCLIAAAVQVPAVLCKAEAPLRVRLDAFGRAAGLGFQIRDDIEDVAENADTGRTEPCYVTCVGEAAARARLAELRAEALEALAGLGNEASSLRALATRMTEPKEEISGR